jgi:hypothetical protein
MLVCTYEEKFVLYCRPGDKEWTKYNVDFDNSHEAFDGYAIFGSKGKIYVGTSWKNRCAVINTTTSDVYIEKMGMAETLKDGYGRTQYVPYEWYISFILG